MNPRSSHSSIVRVIGAILSAAVMNVVVSAQQAASPPPAGRMIAVDLPHPSGGAAIHVEGYVFDDRVHSLRVVDEGSLTAPKFGGLEPAMRQSGAVAGINGGFFGPDGAPLGKMVVDGQATGRLARGALTSGVILRTERGLVLWRTAEFEAKSPPPARQLLQAGPFLVDAGQAVPGLEATRARVRSVVVHDQAHGWVIATTGPVTLADLGTAFARSQSLAGVKTTRVLNLDGGSSSGLWVAGKTIRRPWKPVRNYLAVVPKS